MKKTICIAKILYNAIIENARKIVRQYSTLQSEFSNILKVDKQKDLNYTYNEGL